jgi:hypothetical protein
MKKSIYSLILSLLTLGIFAQSASIDPNYVQIPKVSALPGCVVADKGKTVYNNTDNKMYYCNGTAWQSMTPAASAGPGWSQTGVNIANTNTGNISISANGNAPHPSAILDVNSTSKGLLLPRTSDPTANIASPAAGLMAYNSTSNAPAYYNGNSWQSMSPASMGFKNMAIFGVGTATWTAPSGVTKIYVEGWGGGGGATVYEIYGSFLYGRGAGAGAYGFRLLDVTPSTTYNIQVGAGGTGGNSNTFSTSGGDTQITQGLSYAYFFCRGGDTYGSGGSVDNFYAGVSGENGHEIELSYGNSSAVDYNLIVKLGAGGSAFKGGSGGKGSWFVSKNSSSLLHTGNFYNLKGGTPGGGGGCGYPHDTYVTGGDGGNGQLIIYY